MRDLHAALRASVDALAARGLASSPDSTRLGKNMHYSDAYSWDFPPDIDGPLSLFYSRAWHDLIATLASVAATRDVNAAVHHHPIGSPHGFVHQDAALVHFSDQPRPDGVNPMDLRRCSYMSGATAPGVKARRATRAITMIYYIANHPAPEPEGATGLYASATQPVARPSLAAPPTDNSLLIFENSPGSHHSFIANPRTPRTSIILWLHQSCETAAQRWGGAQLEGARR